MYQDSTKLVLHIKYTHGIAVLGYSKQFFRDTRIQMDLQVHLVWCGFLLGFSFQLKAFGFPIPKKTYLI